MCWLAALEHAGGESRPEATVREGDRELTFEFVAASAQLGESAGGRDTRFDPLRDRVEALGGRLTVESDAARGIRVYGSLPLSR